MLLLFLRRAINSVGRYANTSAYSCRKHDIKAERSNQVFFQKSVILNVNFFRICRLCFISGSISEYHTPLQGRRAVRHNAEKGTKRLTNGYKEGIIIMVFCTCITYYLLAAFRFIISRFWYHFFTVLLFVSYVDGSPPALTYKSIKEYRFTARHPALMHCNTA